MRALFFTKIPCLLATLIISSCHLMIGTEHTKKTYIPGIKISQTFPIIDKTGKLLKYDTSVTNIYFYKDQVLYHSTYHFDSVVQKVLLKSETKDYFFVYSKGRKDGLLYDHYSSPFAKSVLVDSVLQKEWSHKIRLYHIFSENIVTPTFQKKNADSSILSEVYSIKGKVDTTQTGTIFMQFSGRIKIPEYSLSKELDSIKKMKLCKVKIVNNSRYIKEYAITIDKIEQNFSLEVITIPNKEVIKYFEKD